MPVAESASDLLLAIAQLAVALAGFSGLIAAIRTAAPDGWFPRDIWSLSWILGFASIVMAVGAVGALRGSLPAAYVGTLIALLLASVLVLAVFLVLLARMTQRRS